MVLLVQCSWCCATDSSSNLCRGLQLNNRLLNILCDFISGENVWKNAHGWLWHTKCATDIRKQFHIWTVNWQWALNQRFFLVNFAKRFCFCFWWNAVSYQFQFQLFILICDNEFLRLWIIIVLEPIFESQNKTSQMHPIIDVCHLFMNVFNIFLTFGNRPQNNSQHPEECRRNHLLL